MAALLAPSASRPPAHPPARGPATTLQGADPLPPSALYDPPFQRWLERRLQHWTDVAVALGEARWSRLGGVYSRYY